jgi:cell wall assembly regulator SMI1
MNIDDFESAISKVEFVDLIGAVNQASIIRASQDLGITLPTQYQSFIERFGCGGVGSESIIGLGGANHLNFAFMAQLLRTKHPYEFPATFIPIRGDGYGNYDCIDLESVNDAGEPAIVEWLHDGGRRRLLASDFFSWLDELVDLANEGD